MTFKQLESCICGGKCVPVVSINYKLCPLSSWISFKELQEWRSALLQMNQRSYNAAEKAALPGTSQVRYLQFKTNKPNQNYPREVTLLHPRSEAYCVISLCK